MLDSVQAQLPCPQLLRGERVKDQHADKVIFNCDDDVSSAAFTPDGDDDGAVEDSYSGFL